MSRTTLWELIFTCVNTELTILLHNYTVCMLKTESNDFRKIICLRKSEVSDERISVCNLTENLAEHGIHYLPCSYTNNVIDMLQLQL